MPIQNRQLPLFPLNTVLFPGMTLPLRIFEPRYQQMLADCLSNEPVFGVVLIREGAEVGSSVVPYDVGTTARIIGVEKKTPDLIHITTVGEERFRLRQVLDDKPYLVGKVEPFPLAEVNAPEVEALTKRGVVLLAAYLELLSQAAGAKIQLQRPPDDPEKVAYLIAMLLQVTSSVKQRLLSIAELGDLFHEEVSLLHNEGKVLSVMIQSLKTREPPNDTDGPFSKN